MCTVKTYDVLKVKNAFGKLCAAARTTSLTDFLWFYSAISGEFQQTLLYPLYIMVHNIILPLYKLKKKNLYTWVRAS